MQSDSERSGTAEIVAVMRAVAVREPVAAVRNPDHLAEQFVGWHFRLAAKVAPLRAAVLWVAERAAPGLYAYVNARTKHFDSVLVGEVRTGAAQVVILGAGADSRAYRLPEVAGVPFFELDHPATGAWKQQRLRKVLGAVPDRIHFVPVDFNTQTLDDAFDAGKVDRSLPTVFLWEGVAPYLEDAAVAATLESISHFAAGSSVVFDYWHLDAFETPCPYPDCAKYIRTLAARGEPVLSGLDPARMDEYLTARGLQLIDTAGPQDLTRRYLRGARHSVMGFCSITHARVP